MGGLESHSWIRVSFTKAVLTKLLMEINMKNNTYFTLSVEKGIRGNIGKAPAFRGEGDKGYADVMVFLVANGSEPHHQASQIVNVHFPKALFEELKAFGPGDYIQAGFDRIDLTKVMNGEGSEPMLYISVKATSIKLLRKASKE